MPAVPSASNFEEGLEMISILSIWSAGILFSAALISSVIPSTEEGFPLIRNFTLEFPLIDTEPSVSILTEGTLFSTSCRVPPFEEISCPTL